MTKMCHTDAEEFIYSIYYIAEYNIEMHLLPLGGGKIEKAETERRKWTQYNFSNLSLFDMLK